ncbi:MULTISPECIES: PhoX family protein [Calothrix]|uniref:PhoX family phosphatase n=2 Tax=Calothrix TaxID=1186 RepID=A0ABR8AHI1_9CYAN|nr:MULTISPECIES: PhoX family phosphatase [Calothrix]MBD2198990.1 PhoX family phosphatase [Calothrix parietina FACHB-288]MBD2227692.1 PhoX family phosphatase [Calothrix anomala FACHB-343]
MKGRFHPKNNVSLNPSANESIRDVIDRMSVSRRRFLITAASTAALTVVGDISIGGLIQTVEASDIRKSKGFAGIGFKSIPPNLRVGDRLKNDLVSVPAGYTAKVLVAWGDPIASGGPTWLANASQDAAAQEKQFGMHADGMHYFPLSPGNVVGRAVSSQARSLRGFINQPINNGLLCVNHEYTQESILHSDGLDPVSIAKVRKSQAAHGVSVVEISKQGKEWKYNPNSPYGRRITANTEMRISGPAAGDPLLKSKKFDIRPDGSVDTGRFNDGYTAYGTVNNCANGYTPWGTYLTCEENWNGYFGNNGEALVSTPGIPDAEVLAGQNRYGLSASGAGYKWHQADPRFNNRTNPLESHSFGWVVEIDPYDPQSKPVKRTALGRFKHESAQVVVDDRNNVAFYMGDDERNEYIYKFVCSQRLNPGNRNANRDLLDNGVLYVAKFNDNGTGQWIPLVHGQRGLTAENGFKNQAEVLVKTRQAADRVGATMMDRPEWTAVRPRIGGYKEIEVYCTLTNNNRRGTTPVSINNADGSTGAGSARPPVNAANPRPDNRFGHIIRWREDGRTVTTTTFTWDIFLEAGDKTRTESNLQGNIKGDDLSSPDGLWFDDFGRLWIQTDHAGDGTGDLVNIGSNTMSCADPNTKQVRRFLTSPTDCEVTGITTTPDGKAMFINIQHPGDSGDTLNPTKTSNWPASQGYGPSGRPRSATVVITRIDGGVIGGL